jgi:hypothetical protein
MIRLCAFVAVPHVPGCVSAPPPACHAGSQEIRRSRGSSFSNSIRTLLFLVTDSHPAGSQEVRSSGDALVLSVRCATFRAASLPCRQSATPARRRSEVHETLWSCQCGARRSGLRVCTAGGPRRLAGDQTIPETLGFSQSDQRRSAMQSLDWRQSARPAGRRS